MSALTPAQRFDDEKQRIIASCFSKRDEDGSVPETYITHIRITEWQNYPSSPPPPSARAPQYEKPRVIIVAVRKSGRLRVHKSKENANGTFSIGKTWWLDDLQSIESFTSPSANPNLREWARDVGFIVTLGKPYYWEAHSDKEKKFFIASLIKIFNRYTGGRTPNLVGFDQRELDQVLGGAQAPPPSSRRQDRPPPRHLDSTGSATSTTTAASLAAPQPPGPATSTSSIGSYNAPTVSDKGPSSSPLMTARNGRTGSPAQSIDSGRPSFGQQQQQQSQQPGPQSSLRNLASVNRSQDSIAAAGGSIGRNDDASSLRPSTRNGVNGSSPYGTPDSTPGPQPSDEKPPERKRPPLEPIRSIPLEPDLVPAPLTPGMRQPMAIPPRSMDRIVPRKTSISRPNDQPPPSRGGEAVTPIDNIKPEFPSRAATPVAGSSAPPSAAGTPKSTPPVQPAPQPAPSAETPKSPPPEPEEKPGLGPMVRPKKSRGEIAGALWKAATAASAFRPRPGGAMERLLKKEEKKDEKQPEQNTSQTNESVQTEASQEPEANKAKTHKPKRESVFFSLGESIRVKSKDRASDNEQKKEAAQPAVNNRKSAALLDPRLLERLTKKRNSRASPEKIVELERKTSIDYSPRKSEDVKKEESEKQENVQADIEITRLNGGASFGEVALIKKTTRATTATATMTTHMAVLHKNHFSKVIGNK